VAEDNTRFRLALDISIARFQTSESWRAAVRMGGMTFMSPRTDEPVAAVQALLLSIGSGHDNADAAIESELCGGDLFGLQLDTPRPAALPPGDVAAERWAATGDWQDV